MYTQVLTININVSWIMLIQSASAVILYRSYCTEVNYNVYLN